MEEDKPGLEELLDDIKWRYKFLISDEFNENPEGIKRLYRERFTRYIKQVIDVLKNMGVVSDSFEYNDVDEDKEVEGGRR